MEFEAKTVFLDQEFYVLVGGTKKGAPRHHQAPPPLQYMSGRGFSRCSVPSHSEAQAETAGFSTTLEAIFTYLATLSSIQIWQDG